jgi:hypothetical protein
VQVHCDEGVANHIGPEPCAGTRESVGEASAGEHIGQLLSRDRNLSRVPTLFRRRKATRLGRVIASAPTTRRGRRLWHVCTLLAREPGDLWSDQSQYWTGPHREGEEP